jgi:hypothetical protein
MTDDAECAEIRDLIPEIAAGVAAGDERARALPISAAVRNAAGNSP